MVDICRAEGIDPGTMLATLQTRVLTEEFVPELRRMAASLRDQPAGPASLSIG